MIEAKLQVYEYFVKSGNAFYKKFPSYQEMIHWIKEQNEQSFYEVRVVTYKEK
jgi:L-amino acid N-acyltransferase YncA